MKEVGFKSGVKESIVRLLWLAVVTYLSGTLDSV